MKKTADGVMSHIRTKPFNRANDPCERVMAHVWTCHVAYLEKLFQWFHASQRVMSQVRMNPSIEQKTLVDESCVCVSWLIQMCDVTFSDVWCVTWGIHMCDMTCSQESPVWCESFICMCDMTHSDVWRGFFRYVTWGIHTCDMTHSDVWCGFFRCVTWIIHTWNLMCQQELPVWLYVSIRTRDVTPWKVWYALLMQRVTRTRVSSELQVSFRKRATNHRALLRKMTYRDNA